MERDEVLRRTMLCDVPVGKFIADIVDVDIIANFDEVHCPEVMTGLWTKEHLLSHDNNWEFLSTDKASLVMSSFHEAYALYVPWKADPIVRNKLQWMPRCYDVLARFQRPVEKRGCDFIGNMHMIGWRFDTYSNSFKTYSPVSYFSKRHKCIPALHLAGISYLEGRHLPNHANARGALRRESGAPSIFPGVSKVEATTAAVSKGYACDAHEDILDKLPESIGFYPSASTPADWTFALPDSKLLIDLKKGPCMIYVNPQKRHATLMSSCKPEHDGLGSAIFTKRVMVGQRARKSFAVPC